MNEKSTYQYQCASCGSNVTKPATGTTNGRSKTKAGLHGWRCGSCGPTKVVRKVNNG